jgi:hypothetical protein
MVNVSEENPDSPIFLFLNGPQGTSREHSDPIFPRIQIGTTGTYSPDVHFCIIAALSTSGPSASIGQLADQT